MATLIIQTEGIRQREIELKPGTQIYGRHPASDCVIDDPSVSGEHCEISVSDDGIRVKDLSSTNGTFIDGQPVQEADLQPGQTLRLGSVEMVLKPEAAPVSTARVPKPVFRVPTHRPVPQLADPPLAPPIPGVVPEPAPVVPTGAAACVNHPQVGATLICKKCQQQFCDACVTARHVGAKPMKFCQACGDECVPIGQHHAEHSRANPNFYRNLASAFVYPFKKDGLILLIAGTIVFAVLHFAQFLLRGFVSLILMVVTGGYLFAYLQRIIVTSAQGRDDMPDWPDFSNFWDDILSPFLQMVATWLACAGPAILCSLFAPDSWQVLRVPLIVLGLVYLPMALLAVTMYDTIAALNPLLVIPSMLRVALAYFLTVLVLAAVVGVNVGLETLLERLIPVQFVPALIMEFFSLYFLAVAMRIIGLLYYSEERRLNWAF